MKRAIIEVSAEFIGYMFIDDEEVHIKIECGLPDDAKFCACHYDHMRHVFEIIYESEEFADIAEGGKLPTLKPIQMTRIDMDEWLNEEYQLLQESCRSADI